MGWQPETAESPLDFLRTIDLSGGASAVSTSCSRVVFCVMIHDNLHQVVVTKI